MTPPRVVARRLRALGLASVCAAALTVVGCVNRPIVQSASSSCLALIPDAWKQPTPGADLPVAQSIGDWVKFGDAQTGQLDKANGEKVDGFAMLERCEARDAAALAKARKGRWF